MVTLELKVLSEVDATYHLIGCEFFGGTGFEDFTLIEQLGTVGYGEGFIDIVVGDNHADILTLQCCHDALNILNRNWVYTCKRLIKQNE